MVEPVHPLQGGDLHVGNSPPGSQVVDDLGLVEPDDRLGESIVVAVALAADRGSHAGLSEPLRVANREILRAAVAMYYQAPVPLPSVQRLLQRVQHQVAVQAAAHPPPDDA